MLTKSCKFYETQKSVSVTDEIINEIITESTKNKVRNSRFLVREVRIQGNVGVETNKIEYRYTAIVFKTHRPVYFLEEEENATYDLIHAFLVLFEIKNYICIFKQSTASIETIINKYFKLISFEGLSSLIDKDTIFQKMNIRNMTLSPQAIQEKSLVAQNLNGSMSTYGAGRQVPYSFKVNNRGAHQSYNMSSGRINELGPRAQINETVVWIDTQIKKIMTAPSDNFLNNFAKHASPDLLQKLSPTSLLIDTHEIFEHIKQSGGLFRVIKGANKPLSDDFTNKLLDILSQVFEIKNLTIKKKSRLIKNKKTITLKIPTLNNLFVMSKDDKRSLQQIILQDKLFSICFDNPIYMYTKGQLFQDGLGINEIDSLKEIFQVKANIAAATSEKGKFTASSTKFEQDSLFFQVEEIHQNDEILICDDLGNEWADHISFNATEKTISFIHSKFKTGNSSSASNLHDIVGQAIKNLGNMYFKEETFLKKTESFQTTSYSNSSISKFRLGDYTLLKSNLGNYLSSYITIRKCVLCCPFISKDEIFKEFDKLKVGTPTRGHITQLFWIISSFVHSAKELNVVPVIYCSN